MTVPHEDENIFLEIGFRSSHPDGSLKTIELIGVPGEKLSNGKSEVSEQIKSFFDDLIVRKIFSESRRLTDCNFEYLKIWLYDTEIKDDERGYQVPKIEVPPDIEISSDTRYSRLEKIYVLDNELKGRELERWENTVKQLFFPLFSKFIAPPEIPEELADHPLIKLVESSPIAKTWEVFTQGLDPYGRMKQNLFFNALIIQID